MVYRGFNVKNITFNGNYIDIGLHQQKQYKTIIDKTLDSFILDSGNLDGSRIIS